MGPALRTDLVDVYVVRQGDTGIEFLQLQRARAPFVGVWHPVMGHVEGEETAMAAACRELWEETGLRVQELQALEQVHPYFVPELNAIFLSPRFWVTVTPDWVPTLNNEHSDSRWIPRAEADRAFVWPGQRACCREILETMDRG